jgi:hypothetical protein
VTAPPVVALAVVAGLSLVAVASGYIGLIRRAKSNGTWANENVRLVLLSRAVGWPVTGVLLVAGGVARREALLVGAVAVMVAMSLVAWWGRRRNGGAVTIRPRHER